MRFKFGKNWESFSRSALTVGSVEQAREHFKRLRNLSPSPLQKLMTLCLYPVIAIAKAIVTGKSPFLKERGMNFYYDVIDWIGGYPYEHASVEEIRHFLRGRGFKEVRTLTAEVPTGCNEFVFRRIS